MTLPRMPKHKLVENHLRLLILQGDLAPGQKVPNDEGLMERFKCSRGTVRRALQTLVQEGLVRGVRGTGTFVREKPAGKFFSVIVPNVQNPDFAHLVGAFCTVGAARGYKMLLAVVEQNRPAAQRTPFELQHIDELRGADVVGVIKAPTDLVAAEEIRQRLRATGLPYVMLNAFCGDRRGDCHVMVDEGAAAELAVKHLVEQGHIRIGYFSSPDHEPHIEVDQAMERISRSSELSLQKILLMKEESWADTTARILAERSADAPTAIIARYYNYALQAYEAVRGLGLRVPQDISLVSLGGLPDPDHRVIDFTSCIPPSTAMAKRALDLLLAGAQFKEATQVRFRPRLHVGETSGPAPGRSTTPAPVGVSNRWQGDA